MCALKLVNNINSGCSFNLPIKNKTSKLREAYATKMSAKFQEYLLQNSDEKISIKDYKKYFERVINSKGISINFVQLSTPDINASVAPDIKLYREKNDKNSLFAFYTGYKMEVRKQKGKLNCSRNTLVHETRHLFDMLCNPKYKMARHYKNLDNPQTIKQFSDIKNFVARLDYYRPKRFLGFKIPSFEKELRLKLEGLENTEVIDILQISRYHLKSEKNAYGDAEKFELRSYPFSLKILFAFFNLHMDTQRRFNFNEKERVLTKLIKEYILQERFINKRRNTV